MDERHPERAVEKAEIGIVCSLVGGRAQFIFLFMAFLGKGEWGGYLCGNAGF